MKIANKNRPIDFPPSSSDEEIDESDNEEKKEDHF